MFCSDTPYEMNASQLGFCCPECHNGVSGPQKRLVRVGLLVEEAGLGELFLYKYLDISLLLLFHQCCISVFHSSVITLY
jgi:hypothetical protein